MAKEKDWTLRLILLVIAALAATLGVLVLQRAGIGLWSRHNLPGIVRNLPPVNTIIGTCEKDPARLPAPPPSPDGRPANYLHACDDQLYDSLGREVRITGVNWSGLESSNYAPDGLATRKWPELLDQVAALGYNTIRLPYANAALDPTRQPAGISYELNPDLRGLNALAVLDRIIAGARDRGLKVILDQHRANPWDQPDLWYNVSLSEDQWIADWRMLAKRYAGNDTVIAFDLHNEPRGAATWGSGDLRTDWRLAAERAGKAVLDENPYLLIFVEGIENYGGSHSWWGGNLQGVAKAPVRLPLPGRVVYSPHDYGPEISGQTWFDDPHFPKNLPEVWDRNWGYIQRQGLAPVVIGEFGGHSVGTDADGQWQTSLVAFIQARGLGAIVWALNPGWDTGGVFASDWLTVEQDKQALYKKMLAPPLDRGPTGVFGRAPARYRVFLRQDRNDDPSAISFVFQIANDASDPVDLGKLELRYWLKSGNLVDQRQQAGISAPAALGSAVQVDLVPSGLQGQDHYLRVRFGGRAGTIPRYTMTGDIAIRFPQSPWPGHLNTADFSFVTPAGPHESYLPWDKATLYLAGTLVWGTEPS